MEDAVILASNDDFSIYGEERISTESDGERLTYVSSLNQSVFATVTQDTTKAELTDIMDTVSYDDAGNTVDMIGGFGYNGEKLDESGNVYLRARYYNPKLGQFIQIDSNRGEQESVATQNRYTYIVNNQYKYVDPSGHFGILAALAAAGAWVASHVVESVVIGGILFAATDYTSKKLRSNSGTVRLPSLSDIGKTIGDAVVNGVKKKVNDIVKPVVTTITVAKAIADVLPQPCPVPIPRGWDDISDGVKRLLNGVGALALFKWMVDTIKWDKKYKNSKGEVHHIVPWDNNYKDGAYSLEVSRSELKKSDIEAKTDPRNQVRISARLHNRTKNPQYNGYIARTFREGTSKKGEYIKTTLKTLKTAFIWIDNSLMIFR